MLCLASFELYFYFKLVNCYEYPLMNRGTGMLSTRKLKHERADEGAGVRVRL